MANWDFLKSVISDIVKENGNQEITGKKLNEVLNNIISNLGENATYIGIAEPTTSPGSPDGNVFYIARSAGAYSNFDGIQIDSAGLYIIQNKLVQNQEGEFYSKWILNPILIGYADTFSQNPVASSESNGLMSAEDKMKLDSVDSSIVREATVEYYDHSVTDGPDRINTRANIKFLDANNNQLFNAVLFGAGNGYPGLLSLKYKTKIDGYADTFSQNPVASSKSNGLMSAEDKTKLDSVGESEIIDLPWDDEVQGQDGYINTFTERGEYHIHGERLYANDGLPILNAASGHTIDGLMTVLDSSLPNGNKYDVCVTQILRLNNRVGGDGHIFVRTGIATTKSELQRSTAGGWSPWEKLMGVFEKNVVSAASDLNTYTPSGIYDGMFVFSSASQVFSGLKIESGSTFLMIAVNGYAVAQTGVVPQVTQLLYVMPSGLDGSSGVRNAKLYTRTGIYVASTKTYTWGKFDGLAQASDISKLASDIQENSGLIQENQVAITALEKATSALQGSVVSINEHGLSDVNFIQERDGSLSIAKLGLDDRATTLEFPLATATAAGAMSAADKTKVGNYPEQFVLDLGILNSQSEGENIAAASEVAGNRNISFIRFQVQGVSELKTTLIMQWPNGINVTAQIMCVDKAQWRRNVTGATGVKGATTNAFKWERTAPHSIDYDEQRRMIQLKDYQTEPVSQGVELPLAASSKPGLMSSADKIKLDSIDIVAIQDKNLEQDEKIAGLKSALVSQSLSQVQENMFALCDSDGNIALKYDDLGFDVAKISEHFSSLLSNFISSKNLLQVIEVDEPGLYYVDAELNVGEKRDKTGTHAINLVEYINQ